MLDGVRDASLSGAVLGLAREGPTDAQITARASSPVALLIAKVQAPTVRFFSTGY